jgi:hypothetical protein
MALTGGNERVGCEQYPETPTEIRAVVLVVMMTATTQR